MASKNSNYYSFLLRMWVVSDEADPLWRASLEDPNTGGRKVFATLDELAAFLRHERFIIGRDKGKENEPNIER
jgi:hypothetical protein